MSDLNDARGRMVERLRGQGFTRGSAERLAEGSIGRVAEKINRGENPAPTDDASTRAAHKRRNSRD